MEDSRWKDKDAGFNELLKQQVQDLLEKYKQQCDISEGLRKENEELFDKHRKYTIAIAEIKKIINEL